MENLMRLKKVVVASVILSTLFVGGMFALQAIMFAAAKRWVKEGLEISPSQLMMFRISAFWSHFWWLGAPALVALVFLIVAAIFLLKDAVRRKGDIRDR